MKSANAILTAIAKGETRVSALVCTREFGTPREVRDTLMKLDWDGFINVKNDGRTVELA